MIDRQDVFVMEQAGEELLRLGRTKEGLSLLAIVLRVREELGRRAEFRCDVDESVGMAEVVELNGYSRKVPCE